MSCLLKGVEIFKLPIYNDSRGSFQESFRKDLIEKKIGKIDFVQDNQSHSKYGVIRGLHYQIEPFQQSKLVRVISGKILDVVIDLRKSSKTFGKLYSIELNSDSNVQLFIPPGFAHGFSSLSDNTLVSYKVDNYYSRDYEFGIAYNDSHLNIDWKIPAEDIIVSDKDKKLDNFDNCIKFK